MSDLYKQSINHAFDSLKVTPEKGLSKAEVAERQAKYGSNELKPPKPISPFKLFFRQFNDVLIIVLIIAATISLGISVVEHESFTEPILIYVIVLAIAVIGFLNEYKAEKTVEALKKLISNTARVRRDGEEIEVKTSELVPGDIVILEEGQKIPADLRLFKVNALKINEASLTGESVPVNKDTLSISKKVALGDQKNMAFSGTLVTVGTGEGMVASIGQETEIGRIAGLVGSVEEEETPMQKKLDDLGRKIGAIVLVISLIVFLVIFFFNKESIDESVAQRLILAFTAAVALAVAAIPEGLAFVVRISLALGARRMAAKKALVRKLSAVEALGSTDVVCSDKTGTLTRGEMTVREVWTDDQTFEVTGSGYQREGEFLFKGKPVKKPKDLELILQIGLLNNNAKITGEKVAGDPTEASLIVSAEKYGLKLETLLEDMPREAEVPFSSSRKMMSTVHQKGRQYVVYSKGAPDVLLDKCDRIILNGQIKKLTADKKKEILKVNSDMAQKALRILAFAYRESKTLVKDEKAEKGLVFVGLQGMMDPPRKEVKDVMHRVQSEAGMRVLMITGDYIDTAKAVAAEIGIDGDAISGTELDDLSDKEFEKIVEHTSVYARVNPEHKIKIVQALKARGHQVAMTGDGVNDAPAVKAADIGVSMGITGSDATKEASDLILLDDQFLTIINAIEEGRGIFDNVRKFVNYLLSANISEVISVFAGVLLFGRLILTAAQLLFINIVTDGLPAVALGSDPAEDGIMRNKPSRFQGAIINKRLWIEMLIFGSVMSVILVFHYWWLYDMEDDPTRAISVAFASMVVYEIIRLIGIRSNYKIKWFSNPWLSVAIAGSLALQASVLYVPWLANVFGVGPIKAVDWAVMSVAALFLLGFMKVVDIILDRTYPETA